MEYSCVIFKADYDKTAVGKPKLGLRRWYAGPVGICFGFGFISIHFYVEISYSGRMEFQVSAYGREAQMIDPPRAVKMINGGMKRPAIATYDDIRKYIIEKRYKLAWYPRV